MTKNIPLLIVLSLFAFQYTPKLQGNWEYAGGIYNGKPEGAPDKYTLRRHYLDHTFDAFLLEKGQKPFKYQSGNYTVKPDSCLETETFSAQPSKLTGKTLHYHCEMLKDTLVFSGTLPTGMVVQEYWKRVK